jgi:hypothetical protein
VNHELIDERSRQMHVLIAERLRRNPGLLRQAKATLSRWRQPASSNVLPTYNEWEQLLDGDFEQLLSLLVSRDERATRLRQSSPFVGEHFISKQERLAFVRKFHSEPQSA